MEEDLKAVVVQAITTLALVCDHALSADGQGFSKATAGPGHEIAALGSNRWSHDFWDYAARLSSHHSRQLEASGKLDPVDGARLRQAVNDPSVAAPEIPSHWIDVADIDGRQTLVLSMPPNDRLPKLLKNLSAEDVYRPAGAGRLWRVSERWAFCVEPYLDEFTEVGEGVRDVIAASAERATPEDRMNATDLPLIRHDAASGFFIAVMNYDRDMAGLVKKHGGRVEKGGSWKETSFFMPADQLGAKMVDWMTRNGAATLHSQSVEPLAKARETQPSPEAMAAVSPPRLDFGVPENGKMSVAMSRYSAEFVEAIRGVPGRRFVEGRWMIPASDEAVELLAARLDGISAEADKAAQQLRAMAGSFTPHEEAKPVELTIEAGEGKFATVSMSSFVRPWVEVIKQLPKSDRRYDAERQAWKVRNDAPTFTELSERFDRVSQAEGRPCYMEKAVATIGEFLETLNAGDDETFGFGPKP